MEERWLVVAGGCEQEVCTHGARATPGLRKGGRKHKLAAARTGALTISILNELEG